MIWLPPYHDMGLIGGILQPLYSGFPVHLMSPLTFIRNPYKWLETISRYKGTISGGPNFAYEYCINKISEEKKQNLDLSSWDLVFCGAEPIQPNVVKNFAEAFSVCNFNKNAFYPCYGLAESTLIVSGHKKGDPVKFLNVDKEKLAKGSAEEADHDFKTLVSNGKSFYDVVIVYRDKNTLCPENQVGEIWIRGDAVAKGYWENPEQTEKYFHAQLNDDTQNAHYFRTGDLGFLHDKELYITGRIKDILICQGRNLYPQDIEWVVTHSHPALRHGCCVVFAEAETKDDEIVIVCEVTTEKVDNFKSVHQSITQNIIQEFQMSPTHIVLIEAKSLSKTTSGKVQRQLTKKLWQENALKVVSQHSLNQQISVPQQQLLSKTEIVSWLKDWLVNQAGVPVADLDINRPLMEYGLTSMVLVRMHEQLQDKLAQEIDIDIFWRFPSIDGLSTFLSGEYKPVSKSHAIFDRAAIKNTDVAIVGMSCRFPGSENIHEFWSNLCNGVDCVTYADPNRFESDVVHMQYGGYIKDIDQFAASFFKISPIEARFMDPQQRILLEQTWLALEDAGIDRLSLAGKSVGVFVAISTDDYAHISAEKHSR